MGDWVQVVKPTLCCGAVTPMQGHIFLVTGFKQDSGYRCDFCNALVPDGTSAKGGANPVDVPRLKRIPPLEELEGEKSQTTISEMGRELLGLKAKA